MEDLDELLGDSRKFGSFVKDNLSMEDNLSLSAIDIPIVKIYTKSRGDIYLSKPLGEAFYYVIKLDSLKELRESVKFLINHEIGHFHSDDYLNNPRLTAYFSSIKEAYKTMYNLSDSRFPDSEATRYALAKSLDFKNALAGSAAILSFINGDDLELEIELIERHYSSSSKRLVYNKDNKALSKLTDFKLSEDLKNQIEEKASSYLKLLEKTLKAKRSI